MKKYVRLFWYIYQIFEFFIDKSKVADMSIWLSATFCLLLNCRIQVLCQYSAVGHVEMIVEQQQYQHGEIAGGEGQQVGFEGNHAGHGGDDGAETADKIQ